MREIEILYKVDMKKQDIINKVKNIDADFKGRNNVIDIYYYNESLKKLMPKGIILDACFRLRKSSFGNFMTFKENIFDDKGIWQYCNEYETKIEDFNEAKIIIQNLDFKELIVADNCKDTFIFKDYEIVIEEEKTLGTFIEVELKKDDGEDYSKHKDDIRKFVEDLMLDGAEELNVGKPEMLLKLIESK